MYKGSQSSYACLQEKFKWCSYWRLFIFFPTCIIICKSKFTLTFKKKKKKKGHVQSLSKPISGCGTCCWKCHICTLWSAKPLGAQEREWFIHSFSGVCAFTSVSTGLSNRQVKVEPLKIDLYSLQQVHQKIRIKINCLHITLWPHSYCILDWRHFHCMTYVTNEFFMS